MEPGALAFDPSAPFEVVDESPAFDPSAPFEVVPDPAPSSSAPVPASGFDPTLPFEVDTDENLARLVTEDLDYQPTREEVARLLKHKDAQPDKSWWELAGLAKDAAVATGQELGRVYLDTASELGEQSTRPIGEVAGNLLSTVPESFLRGTADLGLLVNQWFDVPPSTLSEKEYIDGWALSVGDNAGQPREWMGAGIQSRNAVPDQLAGQPAPDRRPWDADRLKKEQPKVYQKAKSDYQDYRREQRIDHFLRQRRDLVEREAARLGDRNLIDPITDAISEPIAEVSVPGHFNELLPDHEARPLSNLAEGGSYVADPTLMMGGLGASKGVGKGVASGVVGGAMDLGGRAAEKLGQGVNAVGKIPEKVVGAGVEKFTGSATRGLEAEKMIARGEVVALPAALVSPMLAAPVAAKAVGATVGKGGRAMQAVGRALRKPTSQGLLRRMSKDTKASPALRSLASNLEKLDPALGFAGSLARGGAIGSATGALLTLPSLDEELIAQGVGAGAVFGMGGSVIAAPFAKGMRNRQGEIADVNAFLAATRERGHVTPEQLAQHLSPDDLLNLADAELILGDTDVVTVAGPEQYRAVQESLGLTGDQLGTGAAVFIPADGAGKRHKVLIDIKSPGSRGAILHEIGHALFKSADPAEVTGELLRVYGEAGLAKMRRDYATAFLKEQSKAGRPNTLGVTEEAISAWIQQRDAVDPHWLVDEVFAEQFSAASGQRFRRLMDDPSAGRVVLEKLGGALRRLGLNVKPDGDIPGRSSLFGVLKRDRGFERLVKTYLRQRDRYIGTAAAEVRSRAKVVPPDQLADHPAMGWERRPGRNYEENEHFVRYPDGTVVPKEKGVAKEAERFRVEETASMIPEQILEPDNPTLGPKRQIDGKVTVRGTKLPEAFYNLDSYGPAAKASMRAFEQAIKLGKTFTAWYQQIGTGANWARSVIRGKGNLKVSFREFKPFGFQLSAAGNLMAHVIDVNAVWARAQAWQKAGRLGPWDGALGAFQDDLKTYIRNHQEGRPGAHVIGEAKRDAINAFFGVPLDEITIRDGRGNPNPVARATRKGADSGLVKSFRIDRLQNVKPTNRTDFFFDYRKQQINFQPFPKLDRATDAEYLKAANGGDLETAQRLVDDAAKRAGYDVGPVFHGTPDGRFLDVDPVFRSRRERLGFGEEANVQWFAKDKRVADTYADDTRAFDYQAAEPRTIRTFLKLENPLVVNGGGQGWRAAQARGKTSTVIEQALAGGHDGIIVKNVRDDYNRIDSGNRESATDTYASFSADQIKSADPVTRDDAGNVIPLSERFNPQRQDIRFKPDTSAEMPMSAVNVLYADSPELPKPSAKMKNSHVAAALREVARNYWGKEVNSKNITREQFSKLVDNGVAEVVSALQATGENAANWYTTAVKKAVAIMGVLHPEIVDDAAAKATGAFGGAKDAELGMMLSMAITSQNLSVELNTRFAEEQFTALKQTGRFDPSRTYGNKGDSISGNLELANSLLDSVGWEGLREVIGKDYTVKEISEWASQTTGRKITVAGKQGDLVQGAIIFGPKIGQGFLQNLMGKFNPVTIDLWMRRTWGRWTGDVVPDGFSAKNLAAMLDDARSGRIQLPPSLRRLRAVDMTAASTGNRYRSMSPATMQKIKNDPKLTAEIFRFTEEVGARWAAEYRLAKNFKVRPETLRKLESGRLSWADMVREQGRAVQAAGRAFTRAKARGDKTKKAVFVASYLSGRGHTLSLPNKVISDTKPGWSKSSEAISKKLKPIDAPSGQDRAVISALVNDIRTKLENRGYKTTNADIQAILWYPEKDLWAKLRGEQESNLKSSYDHEFQKIAESKGLGKQAIKAAKRVRAD